MAETKKKIERKVALPQDVYDELLKWSDKIGIAMTALILIAIDEKLEKLNTRGE